MATACTGKTAANGETSTTPGTAHTPETTLTLTITAVEGTRPIPPLFPPHTPGATYPPQREWADVLEFTPYPYSTPLPPADMSPLDGVYAKFDPGDPQWWNCRRCPDYLPAGGEWRLWFDKGILRIYYEVTGFAAVASYTVHGDQLYIFNDPHCPFDTGEYTWQLEAGALQLQEVQDECAIHLRARNLSQQAWLSCQPPNWEAAVSDHWIKPPGCE